jgi:cardiolipin synthase
MPRQEGDVYALHPEAMIPGHRVDLLVDGAAAYPAMLEAIAGATREIHLETYIWEGDKTGERFADALAERARAGVVVRAIIDAVGGFGLSETLRRRMRDAGVQLVDFHPVAPWRRRWNWSVRDHRKVLVVDGRTAFAGGLNLGDEYAPREWGGGAWHDVHVRVIGPGVREIQKEFAATFRYAADADAEPVVIRRDTPAVAGHARMCVLASRNRRGRKRIRRTHYHAMKRARERIWIAQAYFVPDRALRRILRNAAKRGVDVRVMLPQKSDVRAVYWASRALYTRLLRWGVKIFEWTPTMLHAKTVCVDGIWSSVGSYNLDWRSFLYNWELSLALVDPPTAKALEKRFEADLQSCVPVEPATWTKRPLWHRLLEALFYLFRRWL